MTRSQIELWAEYRALTGVLFGMQYGPDLSQNKDLRDKQAQQLRTLLTRRNEVHHELLSRQGGPLSEGDHAPVRD